MRAFSPAIGAQLPGIFAPQTYAAFPVWKDSTRKEVKFAPLAANREEAKAMAVKFFHHARRFERQTRHSGGQGAARVVNGKLSRVGLLVLHALLFDFMNYKTGRLDPCYSSIAEKAGVSISSVYRSLQRLKAVKILNWVRRCSESMDDGRYILAQESNAYGISPPGCWKGYRAPVDPPPPDPGAWGKPAPVGAAGYLPGDKSGRTQEAANAMPDGLGAAVARLHRFRPGPA